MRGQDQLTIQLRGNRTGYSAGAIIVHERHGPGHEHAKLHFPVHRLELVGRLSDHPKNGSEIPGGGRNYGVVGKLLKRAIVLKNDDPRQNNNPIF